ncbi:MAG: PAC2 family protein [Planctomycetes bacterium]|nr:PAC2 family protein [Planctomycetota bacterium]
MVLSLTGWMDGGEVSTGAVDYLIEKLHGEAFAEIEPEDFYIFNFPGSMEISALFRPDVKIEDGLIREFVMPSNVFYCSPEHPLVLFKGKEPHVRWDSFLECLLTVATRFGVRRIYFVGSYSGLTPHTREPRIYSSVSDASLKPELEQYGIRFSDYEGPGSIVTYLTTLAAARGVELATLVAEIPAYVQGRNPKCIEAVVRRLAAMLDLRIDLDVMRRASDLFEERLNAAILEREGLAEQIHRLEAEYDSELFNTEMGDLREWLEQQGIRLD